MTLIAPGSDAAADTTPPTVARGRLEQRDVPWVLQVLLVLVIVAAAMVSGLAMFRGDRQLAVLPLAAVAGVALGLVALTRFSGFVLIFLAVRPMVDLFKLSGNGAGTTEGNTAVARGLDPSSILGVLFLLAALLWLAGRVRSGQVVRGSAARVGFIAFIAACSISVLGSANPQASALDALRIATVAMMFIVLEQLITSRRMMCLAIGACFVGMVGPVVYTLVGFAFGGPSSEIKGSIVRLAGPFSQSNTFGRYLAFLLIFGVAIFPHLGRRSRWPMGILLGISSVLLLLTLTRTAIVVAVLGVLVLAVVQRRRSLAIALVAVALVSAVALPTVAARFAVLSSTASSSTSSADGPSGNSLIWRVNYWTEVLPLANANPVTGIGLSQTQYNTESAKQPHNDFLRAYVETGLVGLGAFIAMFVGLLVTARRAMRAAARGTLEHAVAAGSLAATTGFLFACIAANVVSNVVSLVSVSAFAAAAAFVARADRSP